MPGTAATAEGFFLVLALSVAPTQVTFPVHDVSRRYEQSLWRFGTTYGNSAVSFAETRGDLAPEFELALSESRPTTPAEHVIGVLRRWGLMSENWDGEGARAPEGASIRAATAFAVLLSDGSLVEPMLHASGRAGLYFRTPALYADIEFFGDGRAAYYVERNGDKHKGVVNFDSKQMPVVFSTLLQT